MSSGGEEDRQWVSSRRNFRISLELKLKIRYSPSLLFLLFPPFISPSPSTSPAPVTLTSFNLHLQVRTETHHESPETMSQMVAQREKDTGQKIRKDMFVREKKLIDYEPKYGSFPFSLLRSPLSHLYSLIQLATNYSQAI